MKRGSALLIVLGMIAFMVISAVAFSALMRNSRLPSSYLRRTSASRHLVKAALAEAIDIIDASIGNDRYPGAGDNGTAWRYPRGDSGYVARRNYWRGNCFIGSNRLASASTTVSTLSLEGLAYLPPARINEARYYSRLSLAGQWRTLSFDAGRYAFAAVDVSDHLDINRVFADRGRNSSDSGRITLAHVFENSTHTGSGSPSAENWDDFINEFNPAAGATVGQNPGTGGKLPLTSLADLNLAINKWQPGWVTAAETLSPFCRFLGNGQDFVVDMSSSARIRQMAFVTDSYLPSTNTATTAQYDLCRAQPFNTMLRGNSQMSYLDQLSGSMTTPILTLFADRMTELDTVSLYDYLDENDIPTSLAIPSVEAVPMICALMPSVNFELRTTMETEVKITGGGTEDTPAAATSVKQEMRKYLLRMENPAGQVEALCLFPFRRCNSRAVSFKAEFALRMGFTVGDGPGYRQANGGFVIAGEPDFKTAAAVENGIVKAWKQAGGSLNFNPRTIKNDSDAFKSVTADFTSELNTISQRFNNEPLFTVTYRYTAERIPGSDPARYQWVSTPEIDLTQLPTVASFFHPTAENGNGDGGFTVNYLQGQGSTCVVRPYLTVTARIVSDQSNKTVDLVPATVADDQGFNNLNTPEEVSAVCGSGHSLLTMSAADTLTFSEAGWAQNSKAVGFSPTANGGVYVCPDPRWNFAPQNFYIQDGSSLPDAATFVQNLALGNDGRDNDIFLAVSNQGYMQSPSELAFLPRTTTARLPIAGSQYGSCAVALNSAPTTGAGGTVPYNQLAHGNLMWKTYRLYARNGMDDDNLYDLGIRYEGSGYRVSPYTSSRDILMAALANTPYSWWAASTNLQANANLADESADEFNRSYAFNGMNSNAKFAWQDLESVADNLLAAMRGRTDGNWVRGFHDLDWEGDNSDFCGVNFQNTNADELKDADRKMLYGFWRDSLAARQQLFLIFVRAEPMMMGGGAIGQTPPQLGARAVALVWRDPAPTAQDVSGQPRPHRTRILLYRQFD
ncbi:MAG: hypothetical protein ACI4RD_00440 [Kiritimatiellia bacterium]